MKGLSFRQLRFIDEYLIDLNGAQAAIRAGYSPKAAKEQASRLLTNANVQTVLGERQQARAERVEVTQDLVLQKILQTIAVAMGEVPAPTGEVVWEGAVANRALELLGKHLGMFVHRVQHEGMPEKPVAFLVVAADDDDTLIDPDAEDE